MLQLDSVVRHVHIYDDYRLGVSDSAARAALSRLTRSKLLVTARSGRRTVVRLSARAARVLDDGGQQIFSARSPNSARFATHHSSELQTAPPPG